MNRKQLPFLMYSALLGLPACNAEKQDNEERPNILWLTFEDTSASNFGCYGNSHVSTPVVDSLAAVGIQYMNAWAPAPQSSPARSSLITGCYATTYGMDIHPVSQVTPDGLLFPQLLRDAGYYCTNNNKTHYNTTRNNKACWDECNKEASYNSPSRKPDQPFFAVYNSVSSHMGRIRTFHTDGRRDYAEEGINIDELTLPSYIPDLPEVRSDYAGHLESSQDIDKWVNVFLKDLKAKGLDENTIIFFFSDHGGCIPRGKGYLYESGLRVPMLVYFPDKWKHLAGCRMGQNDDLISFVDLGPTVLSLAGIEPPEHMQGKPMHGKFASKQNRKYQFAFGANQLHHFMPMRAVTDGRYKMIRSYIPYRQFGLRNYYQWGMPSNKAWDRYILSGQLENDAWALPFEAHSAQMLFDLKNDPGEIHDLSADPKHSKTLARLSKALDQHMQQTADLGLFLPDTRTGRNQYEWTREVNYPLDEMQALAFAASQADIKSLTKFEKAIVSDMPDFRFWGVVGYATLAREGMINEAPEALTALLNDPNPYVAIEAAYAISYMGLQETGIERMINPLKEEDRKIGYSALECLSLDPTMRPHIMKHADNLKWAAENLPRKENEDAGLMARGILVNLGQMDIDDLHGTDVYEAGLKSNKGRRKMRPLP